MKLVIEFDLETPRGATSDAINRALFELAQAISNIKCNDFRTTQGAMEGYEDMLFAIQLLDPDEDDENKPGIPYINAKVIDMAFDADDETFADIPTNQVTYVL